MQAADSIGLSLLVGAGYDPQAASNVWLQPPTPPAGWRSRETLADNASRYREQHLAQSLRRPATFIRSHSAKIGAGQPLAFTAARPGPDANDAPAIEWVSPSDRHSHARSGRLPSQPDPDSHRQSLPNGNLAVFSSDGDFLPPNVVMTARDGRCAVTADDASQPTAFVRRATVQPTSFEQFAPPAAAGPLLP